MSFRPIIVTVFTDPALPPFERHGGPVRVGVSCPRGAVRRSEHRGLVDAQFEYARVVLQQYAAWMCANEHPVDPALILLLAYGFQRPMAAMAPAPPTVAVRPFRREPFTPVRKRLTRKLDGPAPASRPPPSW